MSLILSLALLRSSSRIMVAHYLRNQTAYYFHTLQKILWKWLFFPHPNVASTLHNGSPMRLPSNSMHELLISSMTNGKLWLHNLRLPMSRLPTELFHEIFMLVAFPDGQNFVNSGTRRRIPKRDLSWLAITHVCRLWREITLSCANLWTHIDTSKRLLSIDSLERSATAPLEVIIDRHTEEEEIDAVNFALAEIYRIRELEIRWRPLRLGQCTQLLESPAPILESFLFSGASARMHGRTVHLPSTIFDGCSPELKSLTLIRATIPYQAPIFRGLTRLELFDIEPKDQPALRQLLSILSACPGLEKLGLVNAGPKEESSRILEKSKAFIIPKASVKLLSLRDITIDSRTNAGKTLLTYIIVPPVVRISICLSIPPKFPSSSNSNISNIAHISDILPPHIRPSAYANALHMSFDVKFGFTATIFTYYPQTPSPPFSPPETTSFSLKYWLYTRERARRIWPLTIRVFLSLVWRTVLLAQLEYLRVGFDVEFDDEVTDSDSEDVDDEGDDEDRHSTRPGNMSVRKDFWFDLFRLAPQLRKLEIYEDPETVEKRRLRTVRMGLGRNNRQRTPALDLIDALLITNPRNRRPGQAQLRSYPSIRTRFRARSRQITPDAYTSPPSNTQPTATTSSSSDSKTRPTIPWPLLSHLHFNGIDFSFSHDFFSKLYTFLHARSERGDPITEIRIENCVGMRDEYVHTMAEVVGGIAWDGKGLESESEIDLEERESEVDFEHNIVGDDLC